MSLGWPTDLCRPAVITAGTSVSTVGNENRPFRSDLRADVVIVGGGLAGIACAIALADSGRKVMLLEQTGSLGGRARSWTDLKSGDVIDIGPHLLSSEHPNLRSMFEQLGTHDHIVWHASALAKLIDDGGNVEARPGPLTPPLHWLPALVKQRRLSLRDKLSNGPLLWLAMRIGEDDIDRLDGMSSIELLSRYCVAWRSIEGFWAALSMSLLNVPLERCSAGALMRVCARLIGHSHDYFGFADCGLADLYVPAAMRSIMRAGGRVHLRTRVVALMCCNGKVGGVVLEDGTRISARHSVLAVPPQALAKLLSVRCKSQRPFSDTRAFEASPHVSTYLWLDRKLSTARFWTRGYAARSLSCDFQDLSNIRAGWRARASVIASNIAYSHRAESMSDEDIVATTMRELSEVVPAAAAAKVLHSVVNRIPMAIPCPAPGTEQKRPSTRTSIDGLLLAGDWTRTGVPMGMESAVRSGRLAAEQVWSAIGRPRQLAVAAHPPEGLAGLVYRAARHARRRNGRDLDLPKLAKLPT